MGRGGGGGSFGGGGRSGGGGFGGGGRIGGGFGSGRGGGSFGSGSFGSGRGGGSFGGGYRPSGSNDGFNGGPTFGGPVYHRPVYYSGGRVYRGSGAGRGMGCGSAAIVFVVIAFVIVFVLASSIGGILGGGGNSSGDITASTIQRKALPAGSVNETGYYTDELGWIGNDTKLEIGMKNFYQKTGVQPYLYITDTINDSHSPTLDDLKAFAEEQYSLLFTDQAHLLLVFFEYNSDSNYMDYCLLGSQAKTVIDDEARNILLDYVDRYYYYDGLSDEEFFSKSFSDAADRIMEVTTSPWIPVLIVLGVIVLVVILFVWWRHAKKQKNLEAQQTEEMLNKPLDQFGDTEAEELGKKYDDDPNNDPQT